MLGLLSLTNGHACCSKKQTTLLPAWKKQKITTTSRVNDGMMDEPEQASTRRLAPKDKHINLRCMMYDV